MESLSVIVLAITKIFRMSFHSDMDVMSSEAKEIFANDEDRVKYINAVQALTDKPGQSQTIKLSTQEEITLVS